MARFNRYTRLTPAGIVVVAVLVLGIIWITIYFLTPPKVYKSCTEMAKVGKTHVLSSSRDYNPALDADHDGIACE